MVLLLRRFWAWILDRKSRTSDWRAPITFHVKEMEMVYRTLFWGVFRVLEALVDTFVDAALEMIIVIKRPHRVPHTLLYIYACSGTMRHRGKPARATQQVCPNMRPTQHKKITRYSTVWYINVLHNDEIDISCNVHFKVFLQKHGSLHVPKLASNSSLASAQGRHPGTRAKATPSQGETSGDGGRRCKWMFPKIGVKPQKWMVYNEKPY